MSTLKELLKEKNETFLNGIDTITSKIDKILNDNLYNYIKYMETNDTSYLVKQIEKLKAKNLDKSKENVEPNISVLPQKKTNKKKTSALADATFTTGQITIKKEKMSIASVGSLTSIASSVDSETSVRKNDISNMPAPSKAPPRKKKIKTEPLETATRSTRSKAKPKKYLDVPGKSSRGKPSDVIVQNTTIPMVDLSENNDSDTEEKTGYEKSNQDQQSTRTTRTKTRQKKNQEIEQPKKDVKSKTETKNSKRIRSMSSNEDIVENAKRSKSISSNEQDVNKTGQTDYEDAVSNLCSTDLENVDIQNGTVVNNVTMIIEKPKINETTKAQGEPEATKKDWKTPPRTKSKKQQIKEIFSPYENSSLKKKVEAFEKFGSSSKEPANASKIPLLKENGTSGDPGSAMKSKPYTPFSSKFMPNGCSTTMINKHHPDSQKKSLYNDSGLSMRSLSALKASKAEFREREKRRQEKEMEAQLKKEALLQAQAEETKRKREEKQLKAQQQRELLEKEKEKHLELQRLKDEKHKQAVTEKEEKLQKSKEEAEKKRLLAKNKAKTLKEREERQAAQNQQNRNDLPIYMRTRAPLLPSEDCYDSDDEEYRKTHYIKPDWCREKAMYKQLYAQLLAGDKIKNSLFCCTNHNVDLVDLFEYIDPRKLKRTSSAQWRKPPRYTLFSMTSDIHFSEDSEDEIDVKKTPRTKH